MKFIVLCMFFHKVCIERLVDDVCDHTDKICPRLTVRRQRDVTTLHDVLDGVEYLMRYVAVILSLSDEYDEETVIRLYCASI